MIEIIRVGISLGTFMIPLQVSQFLFARKEPHKENFIKRFLITECLYWICGIGIIGAIILKIITASNLLLYCTVFLCSLIVIKNCYEITLTEAVFIATCGYAVQHMAYSLFSILWHYLTFGYKEEIIRSLCNLAVQLLVLVPIYFGVIKKNEYVGEQQEKNLVTVILAIIVLFFSIVLSAWTTKIGYDGNETVSVFTNVICKLYAIISCTLVLSMEFTVSRINLLKKQKEFMEQLIHTQGNQFQMSRESISIINRKCHDIKYQMKVLGMMNDSGKRKEYIDDLRKAISIYDSVYHTGNEVLNLLLREKTLICDEHEIQFSCMADGEVLSFIDSDDLYVLLGNALDNAIESVLKEEVKEKRVISMNIGLKKGIKNIHIENYCKEKVEFQNGLPITSKRDKNYHGFGVQSIKFLTEKYNGNFVMQNMKDTFYLDIFFPS